ncbi:MAG TPA: DUF4105 domain-containing protein [Kofleriaceae bacterium]
MRATGYIVARIAIVVLVAGGCLTRQGGRLTRQTLQTPAADRSAYARELKAEARRLRLASATQWLRLGHWHPTLSGYLESQADGENFFLSPDGKSNPELELEATIDGFVSELAPFDPKLKANTNIQHPICQFPARFAWLSDQLKIDPSRLPPHDCARYEQFQRLVDPSSVALVFSSYYLNNPASAFGHTFLRFHKKNDGVPPAQRELLDFGVEFSADPDTHFAPLYAIKGMIGAFPGTFRRLPYYYKVREYNDYQSRDLWEYELKLTPAQLQMLVAHIWELGSTFIDYFYLSENCSYHILGAVEAADLDVDLTAHLGWPVIPADAVKALYANPGLVTGIHYRASSRTRFAWEIRGMSSAQQDAIEHLFDDPKAKLDGLTPTQEIEAIDAAQDLVDLRFAKELVDDRGTGPGAKLKQALLERRAEILVPSVDHPPPVPNDREPQLGHGSRRIGLGIGGDLTGQKFAVASLRLALHDLADPPNGYPELNEIEFLPARLRYDATFEHVALDQLDLVHVISLTPQSAFDRHVSWEFRLGSERIDDSGCNCYVGHAQFGGGVTFASAEQRAAIFFLANTHVWSGMHLDGLFHAPIRLGIGPEGGLRLRVLPNLIALFIGEWDWLPVQHPLAAWNATATIRWAATHFFALDLTGQYDERTGTGTLSTLFYF